VLTLDAQEKDLTEEDLNNIILRGKQNNEFWAYISKSLCLQKKFMPLNMLLNQQALSRNDHSSL